MRRLAQMMALAAGCLLLLTACAAPVTPTPSAAGSEQAYHKISAKQAKSMIDAGDATIVDVRTEQEYAEAHIPGALLVPNDTLASEPPALLPDRQAVLLVYCRTGVRSKQASDKLVNLGYTQVYDLGGISSWPYDTVSGTEP